MRRKPELDWSVFDAVYAINLRERIDRRRDLEAELLSVGLGPDNPKLIWQDAIRPNSAGGFPSLGAHGCFLSHLSCLQAASKKSHKAILILEDDACFPQSRVSLLHDALIMLKASDWQIWYGGHVIVGVAPPLIQGWGVNIPNSIGIQTAHCIGFNGPATITSIAKLLELILTRPPGHIEAGPMHVDGAYSTWRSLNANALTLATIPAICHQRPSRSDIATLRILDRNPFTRHIMTRLRRLRHFMRTLFSGR